MPPPPKSLIATTARARFAYLALGWVFFSIGFIGVFLPVLPTTPFMILAAWAFARCSPRFYHWIHNHKLFGPPLLMWEHHHAISTYAKIIAVSAMGLSFTYLTLYAEVSTVALIAAGAVMGTTACFILSRPSRAPE